jgi:oxysterol-binding protein-related protein 9/10/11
MGGQVTITCAKSGYSSNIDFLTKPFYGGKKHQIQGQIQGPDKKVLNTIEGDWNGTMFIKTGKKIELFINTNSMNIVKKQLRAISEQNDYESRKLWREVTYYLRKKQIDLATNAKQLIEQKQREGVKKRKETNTKWQTKYFHEQGEHWIFINPLTKRLLSASL